MRTIDVLPRCLALLHSHADPTLRAGESSDAGIPVWLAVTVLVATPILAFAGTLVGHWWNRKGATELDKWRRREETMRTVRWGDETALEDVDIDLDMEARRKQVATVAKKTVTVKPSVKAAANLKIKLATKTGQPIPDAVRKVANAAPRNGHVVENIAMPVPTQP